MRKDVYAVVGSPIEHSKSPGIFNYLFSKYNIDAVYISVELTEKNFLNFLNNYIKPLNLKGLNITMPLKETAAKAAQNLDDVSKMLSSVNTYDCISNTGFTTDGKGLVLSLSYHGIDIKGKNIVVIGAGGAAKSVCYELAKGGAMVIVLNRTKQKAKSLAALISSGMVGDSLDSISGYMESCDVLINCTSMGMEGNEFADLSFLKNLKSSAFVYDIVYQKGQTKLLIEAKNLGHSVCNGIDMLICQAFYGFKIFTGIMPGEQDRNALIKALGH